MPRIEFSVAEAIAVFYTEDISKLDLTAGAVTAGQSLEAIGPQVEANAQGKGPMPVLAGWSKTADGWVQGATFTATGHRADPFGVLKAKEYERQALIFLFPPKRDFTGIVPYSYLGYPSTLGPQDKMRNWSDFKAWSQISTRAHAAHRVFNMEPYELYPGVVAEHWAGRFGQMTSYLREKRQKFSAAEIAALGFAPVTFTAEGGWSPVAYIEFAGHGNVFYLSEDGKHAAQLEIEHRRSPVVTAPLDLLFRQEWDFNEPIRYTNTVVEANGNSRVQHSHLGEDGLPVEDKP